MGGLTRSMFGTLTWPLFILVGLTSLSSAMGFVAMFGAGLLWLILATIVTLAVGVFVVATVWRWAKCIPWGRRSHDTSHGTRELGAVAIITAMILLIPTLLILVPWGMFTITPTKHSGQERNPQRVEETNRDSGRKSWLLGHPQIDFAVTVPSEQVATFTLIRSDSFEVIEVLNHKGFVIAADDRPFQGRVQFGSFTGSSGRNGKPAWIIHIEDDGTRATSESDLPGEWVFDSKDVPVQLNLTSGSSHMVTIAKTAPNPDGQTVKNETLSLQIITQPRNQPGTPKFFKPTHTIRAGSTNWIKSLLNN